MRDTQVTAPADLDALPGDDLSALAWVHGELKRSLENATKALRRYLKDQESASSGDLDAADPTALRQARNQLHQGVGALELVGLPAVATVLRGAEGAVQRMVAKPALVDAKSVDVVERLAFGLLDYLSRLLARKSVSPLMLFPQYREALQFAGADRIHPADLWHIDWQWRELPHDPTAHPRIADDEARGLMEAEVLALMRDPGPATARMSDLCADLGAGARRAGHAQEGALWQLAAAVFEAQSLGLLPSDVYTKRLASRLLAQLRASCKGDALPSDRLAQDLLFFCVRARDPEAGRAPRLMAARKTWRLAGLPPSDYETSRLGRFDPALLVQAKKRVSAAKDAWSAVAGGELHRLQPLSEQMHLVGESLQRLFPAGGALASALEATAAEVVAAGEAPAAALAMEVATSILFLDATLEDGELDQPGLPERLAHLAGRIEAVRGGAEPRPLEIWMEELYRRVSDRQTMGSVVAELRASLSEVEKQIDQYFRNPADRDVLIPVPAQLGAMRGVLSVLGMDQASQAALHMRDDVDALAQTEVDPQRAIQAGTFDRLADNLGALSFLIDMLSVQPQLAKNLFRFDPETGNLTAVMGRTERVSAFSTLDEPTMPVPTPADSLAAPLVERVQALARAAADPGVADAQLAREAERLAQAATAADQRELGQLLASAQRGLRDGSDPAARARVRAELAEIAGLSAPAAPEPAPPPAPVPAPKPAPAGGTGLEDDAEMREIFVEEAREVVADAQAAVERLLGAPDNLPDMTTVRRAFHTLKGSSRMIGLKDFGEAAWSCEQLYNARLASDARMDGPLREFTGQALAYLGDWVEAVAAGSPSAHESAPVSRAADALRLEGRLVAVEPAAPAVPGAAGESAPVPPVAAPEPLREDAPAETPDLAEAVAAADAAGIADLAELAAIPAAIDSPAVIEAPEVIDLPELALPEWAPAEAPASGLASDQASAPEPAPDASMPDSPVLDTEGGATSTPSHQPPQLEADALPEPVVEPVSDRDPLAGSESEPAPATEVIEMQALDDEAAAEAPVPAPAAPTWAAAVPEAAAEPTLEPTPEPEPKPATDRDAMADSEPALVPDPLHDPITDIDLGEMTQPDYEFELREGERTQLLPPAPPAMPDGPTIVMPVSGREAPPAPQVHHGLGSVSVRGSYEDLPNAPVDADFELHFEDLPPTTIEPPRALADRVPDLPSAGDLDFLLTEPAAEPGAADAPVATALADLPLDAPESAVEATTLLPPSDGVEALEIDLAAFDEADQAPVPPTEHTMLLPVGSDANPPPTAAEEMLARDDDEQVKVIGDLRISIPLFNIYLNEADELSRRLVNELAEWALEPLAQPVPDSAVALAHSLAGSSATVGYADLSALARALEHALMRSAAVGHGRDGEPELFNRAAEEIRRLLHQFAAGFLRPVDPTLTEALAAHERWPMPVESEELVPSAEAADDAEPAAPTEAAAPVGQLARPMPDDDIDVHDAIDAELFPIFEEEADELLPQLQQRLREWHDHPGNPAAPAACMRTLHTFKGGARLAGALRLGEMAHRLESAIEALMAQDEVTAAAVDPLLARADAMSIAYDRLRHGPRSPAMAPVPGAPITPAAGLAAEAAPATPAVPAATGAPEVSPEPAAPAFLSEPAPEPAPLSPAPLPEPVPAAGEVAAEPAAVVDARPDAQPDVAPDAEAASVGMDLPLEPATAQAAAIDWARFLGGEPDAAPPEESRAVAPSGGAAVRVRAALLDRLVNNAGEVSITRSRIDGTVTQLQGSLGELTESLERMRRQLRDIELQAETQIAARVEAAKSSSEGFDPLEMDRFTRFQELTRFMAESVNDVATLQRSLQRALQTAEDELAAQARLTRELQDDLLRTRMVEFESIADRLYRCVRQAARDTGKQARLDLVGGGIEIDRGVLERMVGSFEHLLRNSIAHGIEAPAERSARGKDAAGIITVTVAQSGNEVAVEFADDGGGLDLGRIRRRGIERGLIAADAALSDDEVAGLIFAPGFSTAESVTELAGRGVGLDVVRAEVSAMGGRVLTHSEPGRGTRFRLLLPLTTAVTQVVMLRCGATTVAVPSPLIEVVRRVPTAEVEQAYARGALSYQGEELPFFWLAALLQADARGGSAGRSQSVVIVRSAAQRVAVHVDEVVGNQDVVVKNVGPQLSRLPGLAGVTLLPSGAVALIYNPVALATVYAESARAAAQTPVTLGGAAEGVPPPVSPEATRAPLVLVVDDSLTVRRVTQRLLVREGYRVVTAKDGLDALERLAEERPAVLLSDIEMPRMDGFDLVRNVRADARLASLPVIMITSRIAQKHRDYAAELGVDHYLGKPYSEEELLALIAAYVARVASAP